MAVALADLLEAEGRALRRTTARLGLGLGMIALAVLFAAAGLGLCLWAAYQYLASELGQTLAVLLAGVVALVAAGLFLWLAKRLTS